MGNTIRKMLGLEESSEYVSTQIEGTNRGILRYESVFIAGLALVVLVSSYFPIVPWTDMSLASVTAYRVGMLLVAVASIGCNRLCAKLADGDSRAEAAIRQTRVLLITYTTALLVIAIVLTVIDYPRTGSFFVYVVALVLIFGLLYIAPIAVLFISIAYTAVLGGILAAMGQGSPIMAVTLVAYAFIVIVVSFSNYQTRIRATVASEEVVSLSRHDSLTGVKNRRAVAEDAPLAVGREVHLLLADIDDFKFYNDSFGHDMGDELLRAFADSLCAVFGRENVYRYGGDEFIAVAFDMTEDEFLGMVAEWRDSFAGAELEGGRFTPTTSGGYVHGKPESGRDLQDMLRLADIKLYDAKEAGRNKVLGMAFGGSEAAAELLDAENLRERRLGDADSLTGLPSMTYFLMHARSVLESPQLADAQFYLVYFNIENMKAYNERFGMMAGDELLAFTARSIKGAFDRAIVTRMGDDRFVLLDYGGDPVPGIKRVHAAVRAHNDQAVTAIRAGVYAYERGVELSAACDLAKLACDHIKGRHDMFYYRYDERLHEARERRQFILDRFEDALANGHVQPHYQPIVRSIGGRVSEFEALARWIDPESGFVSPGDFIPVLEEYRLVHLLDLHIIRCACRDLRALSDAGLHPVPVNVNLSRYDLELCDIVGETAAAMREHGIAPDMLNIEITESAFSENTELLAEAIERFHELGTRVWMDDFGSGYSSLNVLREFRFDVVKLDMGFLRYKDDEGRLRSRKMIPHLVNMAKELGLQTLIEGVEDEAQRDFLREAGIEKLQGFAFGRPGPVGDMRAMLEKGAGEVEALEERAYYDPIGQLNLSAPVDIDPELAHSLELSSGLPAAIVEFRDGRVGYLHWNSSYIDYLGDIGMHTIENSTAQMNDLSRPQSQGFFKASEYLRGKQEWLNLSFQEGDETCTGMARCVAVDEASGATAFLYIAYNVTRYLARAGLANG